MAVTQVNTKPLNISFESIDGRRYKVYVTNDVTPSINTTIDGFIGIKEYALTSTIPLNTKTLIKAYEVDVAGNTIDQAIYAYSLKSIYDSVSNTEKLEVTQYLVDKSTSKIIEPGTVFTKDITSDRTYKLPFKRYLFEGFNPGSLFTPDQAAELYNQVQSGINNTSYGVDFGNSFDILYNQQFGSQITITNDDGTTSAVPIPTPPFVSNTTQNSTPEPTVLTVIEEPKILELTTVTDEVSTRITWKTSYIMDGRVVFVGKNCPEISDVISGFTIKKCETDPIPANYKQTSINEPLLETHDFTIFNLKPNTEYTFYVESRAVTIAGEKVVKSPNQIIKTKSLPEINKDVLFFEVAFLGNYQDDPDMFYDKERQNSRVKLKFDYNQDIKNTSRYTVVENGISVVKSIDITKPILDQEIQLFSNTDQLAASKKFITESPNIDLGFKIEENFNKDTFGNQIFVRDVVYYTVDVSDSELAGGFITINEQDIATEQFPNRKWKKINPTDNGEFLIGAEELLRLNGGEIGNRLIIFAGYKKRIYITPIIEIPDKDGLIFDVPFSERNLERIIEIPYKDLKYANGVEVRIGDTNPPKTISFPNEAPGKPPLSRGIIKLSYLIDFNGEVGRKLIQINPVLVTGNSNVTRGDSISFEIKINAVDDFPNILSISRPTKINVPAYGNLDADYKLFFTTTLETSYVDVFVEIIPNAIKPQLIRLLPKPLTDTSKEFAGIRNEFEWIFNIADKIEKIYPAWDKQSIKLTLIPYSNKKISDPLYSNLNDIKGLEYPIITEIVKPKIQINLEEVKKLLLDMIIKSLNIESPKENKYISHLANFGNDQQLLISSWENDNWTLSTKSKDEAGNDIIKPEDEIKSIIVKLYTPLPQNIQTNSTFWITKLLANPIVETVLLREDLVVEIPNLRGPNFNIPIDYISGQSTAVETLDTLILSASVSSSAELMQQYLSKAAIDTSNLNIQYVTGSINDATTEYIWKNFVNFSSAKERLDNFVYKVQLIEVYETAISQSLYDPTNTKYPTSFTVKQNIEVQTDKKNKIIGAFDGFEKFLYTSSSVYTTNSTNSVTWPYNNGVRMQSTTTAVSGWYNTILDSATEFDRENQNSLYNNIPDYIKNAEENDQLILFIAMIGQHFDLLYFFTKAIERSRSADYSSKNGIANKLLYDKLKAFNWDAKNLSVNSKLWEYVLGMNSNGNIRETKPAKERNDEIWRRILNNLPYLLKHKGTKRAVHALLACYGIPSTNLSILEFGGPEINGSTTNKAKFIIENISTGLKVENASKITTLWTNTPYGRKPDTVELFIKPAYANNWTVVSGSGWSLTASGSANSKYGRVFFKIGSTNYLSSSVLPIFNGDYFGISLAATTGSTNYNFELNAAQNKQERRIFLSSTTASIATGTAGVWQTAGQVAIGSGYSGSVDEFRLWSTPLNSARFLEHVAFPEMVNGNNISSSTGDLFFRLDFEYPKNVTTYTTTPNVDNNIYYSQSLSRNDIETTTIQKDVNIFSETSPALYSASFSGFTSVTSYPYQFEIIERNSVLEMPDIGIQRYSNNKIRFEEQSFNVPNVLFSDKRNTIKAYDNAPSDSNRLGLFFSPTKELNIDIAKSLGGINLDDYIGDPRDQYKDNYSSLDALREYYFNRFDGRDIYAYINLVKMYEQNLFEDIKQLVPARAKLTTGILIEPHILERSKIARKKPSAENNQYETTIEYNLQENLSGENSQYETEIDTREIVNLVGENNQYETSIDTTQHIVESAEATQYEGTIVTEDIISPVAEVTQYEGNVESGLKEPTLQTNIDWTYLTIGVSDLEDIGLGLYVEQPGVTIRNFYDTYGILRKERVRANIVTKQVTKYYKKFVKRLPNGLGDPRGGTILTSSVFTENVLTVQPFDGTSAPTVHGEITAVTPVFGYLPTHYKYTQDDSRGLQNSFYYGCKLSGISPIDGKPVVEEFNSNPNTLTVNKFGRSTNEPILEVE